MENLFGQVVKLHDKSYTFIRFSNDCIKAVLMDTNGKILTTSSSAIQFDFNKVEELIERS